MPLSKRSKRLGMALTILDNARDYLGEIKRMDVVRNGKPYELLEVAINNLSELDTRIRREIKAEFRQDDEDDQTVRTLLL